MSIVEYLQAKVGFPIERSAILSILIDRGLTDSSEIVNLTQKQKDLLYADMLLWASSIVANSLTRGDFKMSIGGVDSMALRKQANGIYKTYGDSKYDSTIDTPTVFFIEEYDLEDYEYI